MYDVNTIGSFGRFSPPPGHDDEPRMNGYLDDIISGGEVLLGVTPVIAAYDYATGSSVKPNLLLDDKGGALSVSPSGGTPGGKMAGGAALTGAVLAALAAHGFPNDVKGFQRSAGITADGIVGPITLGKLGMVGQTPPAPSQSAGLTAALPSVPGLDALSFGGFSGEVVAGALAVAALGAFLVFKKKKGGKR